MGQRESWSYLDDVAKNLSVMKICFFTENYYKGGLDTFLINLINSWPDKKDELTIVCNGTHPGLDTIAEKTFRPVRVHKYYRLFTSAIAQGQSTFFVWAFRFMQYPILFPWYVFTLMLFFLRSDYDRLMVVNGGYPASLLCRSAVIAWWLAGKRPLAVMNFHNSTTCPPWYYSFLENSIDALVIRATVHIVSVSKDCLDSLGSRNAFLDCNKLSYIYNGIKDPIPLVKTTLSTIDNMPTHKGYCLMLGTYEARKGHAYLLQAFQMVVKEFPNVQLQTYGYGQIHEKKRVVDEIFRLKLENNVTVGDFTTHTAALFSGASILVMPSQANESFGLTIIEAMAFGVPVVTTDLGGMPEVLEGSNAGYVCSKDDPLEFSDAIKNILRNPTLAYELGRNGRLTFERRFKANTMAINYANLLE
jgi:L-malate glycosyltransferase